uniref:Uncharacterized protein n=1 Tax=Trieres chinensis TaxID=1514140 RepID=A0A7S2EMK8_TRICV
MKGDGFHDPLGEKHGHNWPSREDALRGTVRVQRHSASQPSLQAFQSSAHHQPLLQTNAHRLGYLSQNGVGARGGKTTGHTQRHRASWTAQMNPEDDPSKAGGSETTGSNPVKRMSSPAVLAIRRSSLISSESSVSTCNDSDSSRTNQTETGQLNLRELLGDKHHEKLSAEFFQKHGIEDQSKDERKKEGVKSVMEETPRTTKKLSPEEQKEDTGDDVTTRMRDINKQLKEFKEELRRYKRRSIANAYAHQKISLPCDPMDRSYLHLSPRTPAEAEVISIHGMPRGQKNEGAVEMKNTMMRREEIHQPYLLNRERGLSDIPADTVDGPRSSVVDDSGWYYGTKASRAVEA